jgi:hypothetical protein
MLIMFWDAHCLMLHNFFLKNLIIFFTYLYVQIWFYIFFNLNFIQTTSHYIVNGGIMLTIIILVRW